MISGSVVFYKIATTCLLIFVGYIARRMKLLPEISVSVLSRYITFVALPSYIIYYMPATISRETLGRDWYYPAIGLFLVAALDLFGWITGRMWARPGDLATFRQLVALSNWVFMALAVCEPIFGETGVRIVLLYNIGIMIYAWSFGLTSFRSGVGAREILKQTFLNVQTLSNVIGFCLTMTLPFLKGMESISSAELAALPWYQAVITPFWETIYLLGSTALPLSIFQVGVILGKARTEGGAAVARDNRSVVLVCFLRLLAAPVITIAQLLLIGWLGLAFSHDEFVVSVIIMAMPAAVLCISVSEVYGGNPLLAARCVLWSTLASLLTAPLLTWLAVWAYPWA